MRLQIDLNKPLTTKLRHLAIRDLRPLELQAEYLLIHAIQDAHTTANLDATSPPQECQGVRAEVRHA